MSAHTAGPWHWEADAVKGDQFGRVRYQVTAIGETVTRMYYSSFEGGPTNAEANARLIAAAPELLAALQKCAVQLEQITGLVHDERCALIDARAAIAKATGEAA